MSGIVQQSLGQPYDSGRQFEKEYLHAEGLGLGLARKVGRI